MTDQGPRRLRKSIARALVVAVLLTALGYLAFERWVRPDETAPVIANDAPVKGGEEPSDGGVGPTKRSEGAIVTAVVGTVERSSDEGHWMPLRPGQTLHADDAIRTGSHSQADVRIDDKSHFTVTEVSQL